MPADRAAQDRTMGGEHPIAAIKRLAHWEVEDDLQTLRTRLACISAQVDKVAPADRAALVARLRVFAADMDALQLGAWADGMREAADVIAALTAPPEAAPTHGWQPIETAPPGLVDGKWTYVLFSGLSKGRSFPGRVVVSGWMGKTHDGRYEPVHNYSYKLFVTHWMPIPPDPDAPSAACDYTPVEQDCRGCMGPCGRCHEAESTPDCRAAVRAAVEAGWDDCVRFAAEVLRSQVYPKAEARQACIDRIIDAKLAALRAEGEGGSRG